MFEPRLALASLSGESNAQWALDAADAAGAAILGGVSIDEPSRAAARKLVARDRTEFLPDDPIAFIDDQLSTVAHEPSAAIRPGINVRSTTIEPIREAASICADHDAILELNAHCRQPELRAVGCGETLLADCDRLADFVAAAADIAPAVSVKVRAEVETVDLVTVATRVETAGADVIHVDAMDSETVIADIAAATELFIIANNEVRDRRSVRDYIGYGADAVSVGRPSRRPEGDVLHRVADAVTTATKEPTP